MGEDENEIIARLTRKNAKITKQNCDLRKYAKHKEECEIKPQCTCGLDKLMNPKRQEPV